MASDADSFAEEGASRPTLFDEPKASETPARRQAMKRVPLARNRRRLSYDVRLRFWLLGLTLPTAICVGLITWLVLHSIPGAWAAAAGTAIVLALLTSSLFERITRPLQTLANVVSALREDDFSFRARSARRGDSLGDLALETTRWRTCYSRSAV